MKLYDQTITIVPGTIHATAERIHRRDAQR